jgi:opacity protein-like surface antigen
MKPIIAAAATAVILGATPHPAPARGADAAGAIAPGRSPPAEESRVFLTARVGAFVPQGDLEGFGFATAVDFEVGVGVQLARVLAAELAFGRYATSGAGTLTYDEDGGTTVERLDGDLEVMSLTATLKAFAPIPGRLRVYALGGAGVYRTELSGTWRWTWTDGAFTETGGVDGSERDSPFGFHAGAGLGYLVTPRLRLGVEAKYAFVSPELAGEALDASGVRAFGELAYRF